ncbi:MAG: glycosyltransferase family 4 protein [Caldilineaceae bacterium]|nr:glycosyltransferase family 4 protein [Caldilineaceae bacterium]
MMTRQQDEQTTVPRRIAFVAPFGLGEKTTVWARTLPLASELVRRGDVVTIIIPPWDTPDDSGRSWQAEGVDLVNVALTGGLPFVLWRMLRALDRFQPDIVHIVKPRAHAGLLHWLFWQRRHLLPAGPRILLDVDDWEQAWAAINHYPRPVARFLAWQEEWGIRHADGITAASRWLVERAELYAPNTPVLYLPNGITPPPTVAEVPPPTQTTQILFYSRYVEVTPAWLADFWCALHCRQPTATLLIFGDALNEERPALFRRAMKERCPTAAAQVIWQAYNPVLVDTLYQTSACAIFPAAQTPLHEAKCSVRLATTLLRGVPVVASAVGEQQTYGAGGAAELVAADAPPETFARVVADVLEAPQKRLTQQHRARQRLLQMYNWGKLTDQLSAFYCQHTTGQ